VAGTVNHPHEALLKKRPRFGWLGESSWIWGIAVNVVSAKIQPLRLIQPCRR